MIKKAIVLGGGSAGLLAALTLNKKLPGLDVLVIRSKAIGVIGVGEGSTAGLTHFLHEVLNIGPRKFFQTAQPTWKLGLRFLWGKRPYFNYTFGPGLETNPPSLPKAAGYYCEGDLENADLYSAMMTADKAFVRQPNGGPAIHGCVAYHFENERLVTFLEELASARGVRLMDDTVAEVRESEAGIGSLLLKTGQVEQADLYVDCSGFTSLLLGKTLKEPFVDYKSTLFCDRAIVGGWTRTHEPIKPYTTCETMDSGWAWQIEHESRINRGYVYCSDFISDEEAEREFRRKNPLVGSTRIVKFIAGRYANGWVKNVVAIGNAGAFVEPLEATALGIIALQSQYVCGALIDCDRDPRPATVRNYNRSHARIWDGIRDFLSIHYRFNERLSTPFWQFCREKTDLAGATPIVEVYRDLGPTTFWTKLCFDAIDGYGMGGYAALLMGQGVPFHRSFVPSEKERSVWEQHRRQHQAAAAKAMGVGEALKMIRQPPWQWDRP